MAAELNDKALNIIRDKNFAHFGTLMPDGSPQVNPVWVDVEDGNVIVNSADGRQKVNNVRREPRVSIEVTNSDNPYEFVEVRGHVVDITEEGADDHIDAMAKKYMGVDSYPLRKDTETRVKLVIEPDKVIVSG
jgi:PPOX class probable F420-dependent enzyme